jgi:UDP-N-acetylmuramoylalanine--D-glutamate ligase
VPLDLSVLDEVRDRKIPICGELALAAPHMSEMVVAVTGTNGKTTVTALIAELLRACGKTVFVGGNIGTPVLDYVCANDTADVLVLELSSFQLESAGTFRPDVGLLLNISADHLDRHKTLAAYTDAKMNLFARQKEGDRAVVCDDPELTKRLQTYLSDEQIFPFGRTGDNSSVTICRDGCKDEVYALADTELDSYTGKLNAEAAILAAVLLQCEREGIERGLRSFTHAPHRLQFVRERNGVRYFDDSKATNSSAVLSALQSFEGNVILIAGGKEKGEDFAVLRDAVQEKVKFLILIGEAAASLEKSLHAEQFSKYADSMEKAVILAVELAETGDVVLLAPACASFDMFDNYGQRGDIFTKAVMDLPESQEEAVC